MLCMLREDIGKILDIDVVEYGRICRGRDIETKPCVICRSLQNQYLLLNGDSGVKLMLKEAFQLPLPFCF